MTYKSLEEVPKFELIKYLGVVSITTKLNDAGKLGANKPKVSRVEGRTVLYSQTRERRKFFQPQTETDTTVLL